MRFTHIQSFGKFTESTMKRKVAKNEISKKKRLQI